MMKKHLTILTLIFPLMFSSTSYAEWTKVSKNSDITTFYVDFKRIRKVDGYVYFWLLADFLKPINNGILSAKIYSQGDCKQFREKHLSIYFYKEPMGDGDNDGDPFTPPDKWAYPLPESSQETFLKSVCDFVK